MWTRTLLAAATSAALLAQPASTQNECGLADSLSAAKAFEQAQAAYAEVLRGKTAPQCAYAGVQAVARERARAAGFQDQGRALERSGRKAEARAAYLAALAADPQSEPARAGLDRTLARAAPEPGRTDPFAGVRTLAKLGLHADALAAMKEVIAKNPAAPVPDDLEYLSGSNIPFWAQAGRRDFQLAAGLVFLLLWVLYWRWGARPRLNIEEIRGASDPSVGKGFAAMVEDQIKRLTSGLSSGNVSLVTGPIEPLAVPAAVQTAIPPSLSWLSALPALGNWLVPRRALTVSGHLHWTAETGPGITLTLKESGRVLSTITTWETEYGTTKASDQPSPSTWHRLAEPTAVWLLYSLMSALRRRKDFALTGTTKWRSFALFRAGVRAESQGDEDTARQRYLRAIRIDPRVRGARVNLSSILSQAGEHAHAIRLAQQVFDELEQDPESARTDPAYYSALYRIAAIHFNMGTADDLLIADERAALLVSRIDEALRRATQERRPAWIPGGRSEAEARLREYLETIRPAADLLAAGIRAKASASSPAVDPAIQRVVEKYEGGCNSAQTHYNVACVCSILAEHVPEAEQQLYLNKALDQFDLYLLLDGRGLGWALKDPSLSALREKDHSKPKFAELLEKYGG